VGRHRTSYPVEVPADFPTADKVSLRAGLSAN